MKRNNIIVIVVLAILTVGSFIGVKITKNNATNNQVKNVVVIQNDNR